MRRFDLTPGTMLKIDTPGGPVEIRAKRGRNGRTLLAVDAHPSITVVREERWTVTNPSTPTKKPVQV